MLENDYTIAALDIGSSKVTALLARVLATNEMELIGIGVSQSFGIKSGSVTNIERTVQSIREAIEEIEMMTNYEISEVILNVSGKHVYGDNSVGVIAVTNRERVVTAEDVYRVIDASQSIRIPQEHQILHVLSREFKVDDQNGIKDPTGMVGIRLEADVHIVTGHSTHIRNMEKAVLESGVQVDSRVLSAVASGQALLTEGEKELGVAVADIGSGIIDIIIYTEGGVSYTSTICIGASHITHDISIGLKTPLDQAELLKIRHGACIADSIDPGDLIEIPTMGSRPPRSVPRKEMVSIIEARGREILELIDHELIKSGKKSELSGGLILTGGGALLEDFPTLAEEVTSLSSSLGYPRDILGITDKASSPAFSTAVGLLKYGAKYGNLSAKEKNKTKVFTKMKKWLQENL